MKNPKTECLVCHTETLKKDWCPECGARICH